MLTNLGPRSCIEDVEIKPRAFPAGIVVLATGIPSGSENIRLFFLFIADTTSKRAKILKPRGRTTQFFAGLHCRRESSAGTELVIACLACRPKLRLKGKY
jgi:hypothetical protein